MDGSPMQRTIASELGVTKAFDVAGEVEGRVDFLTEQAAQARARVLVLGISGGIDSTVTGMLCALACARSEGALVLVAVRLPYGVQADDEDAQMALQTVRPGRVVTVDIRPPSDAALAEAVRGGLVFGTSEQQDFVLGNIKARQRMVVQYAVANTLGGLVVGTDHAAEAVAGFFTKFGDGGVDVTPLTGLTKRRVRALGMHLGVPKFLVDKTPTADLDSLRPQLPDEVALGLRYDDIDDFLECRPVPADVHARIVERYRATAHKRAVPASP